VLYSALKDASQAFFLELLFLFISSIIWNREYPVILGCAGLVSVSDLVCIGGTEKFLTPFRFEGSHSQSTKAARAFCLTHWCGMHPVLISS